jgi:hypothetical protein
LKLRTTPETKIRGSVNHFICFILRSGWYNDSSTRNDISSYNDIIMLIFVP